MRKNEIATGGTYVAKVSGKITTVRVDAIREVSCRYRWGHIFYVTNLMTDRKLTFHSAAKFRSEVTVSPFAPMTAAGNVVICSRETDQVMEKI